MTVTVIATGFEGMNGEKARPAPAINLEDDDDDFLSSSSTSSSRSSEPKVDPAVIDDDDTFTDIMSIFNRK